MGMGKNADYQSDYTTYLTREVVIVYEYYNIIMSITQAHPCAFVYLIKGIKVPIFNDHL